MSGGGMTSGDLRHSLSFPKLQLIDRFDFLIVRTVKISFRSPDMSMAHKALNSLEIGPIIQKACPEGMPHGVWGHSLSDEGFFAGAFDQTVNRPGSEGNNSVRTMLPQGEENWVIGVGSVFPCLPILLDGCKGHHLQGDPPKLLTLAHNIENRLITIGLYLSNTNVADLAFPESCCE